MGEYIKKTDILAEIKRRYEFHKERNRMEDSAIQDVLYGILNFLDTIKMKEVDLEKEIDKVWDTDYEDFGISVDDFYRLAKHFFELGMQVSNKAQKGEKV